MTKFSVITDGPITANDPKIRSCILEKIESGKYYYTVDFTNDSCIDNFAHIIKPEKMEKKSSCNIL